MALGMVLHDLWQKQRAAATTQALGAGADG
jgi:hypothetical protein